MPQSIVASAPGSLMLFGEHSVLRGGTCLVAAVEPRLTVTLTPTQEQTFIIHSSLGTASTSIHSISLGKTFRFVEKALSLFQGEYSSGAKIVIDSEINPLCGLGSSAAVTVATVSCLCKWRGIPCTPHNLLLKAREIITSVQGCGSGADAASIIWGGIIEYTIDPLLVTPLRHDLPLTLVYSGKKTPTQEVIAYVNQLEHSFPQIFKSIFISIEKVTKDAAEAIKNGDWKKLGALMDMHHGLQEALLVGTPELSSIYWKLKASKEIFGAKISGSGLGDSVIALGSLHPGEPFYESQLPAQIASEGVRIT